MSAEILDRPVCSCGQPMIRIHQTEVFICGHCDRPCPRTEETCHNHRELDRAVLRKHESTAPPKEMRRGK